MKRKQEKISIFIRHSQKLKSSIKHPVSFVLFVLIAISVIFTVVSLGFLIGYTSSIGNSESESPKLFAWLIRPKSVDAGRLDNTIWMTILALVIAIPFGIGAAVYMVEYSEKRQ